MRGKNLRKFTVASILVSSLIFSYTISNASTHNVFIDAGHGGKDNGSSYNGYLEDNINLQIARRVESKLMLEGFKVEMSRNDDTYVSLSDRAFKSNNSSADVFISIHQNASLNKKANGIETYYLSQGNKDLADIVHKNLITYTNATDRGVRKGNFQVLRDNRKPSILLECGFISNQSEGDKLNSAIYQDKLASAIVDGIKDYLKVSDLDTSTSSSNKANVSNYATALNDVNVMSDRGKNFEVIGKLPRGTKVEVIDTKFDWHKIKYKNGYGYVSGVYVK